MLFKAQVGDLVYYSIDTGESIIGTIIELDGTYNNKVEWSNGVVTREEIEWLEKMHHNYLDHAKKE